MKKFITTTATAAFIILLLMACSQKKSENLKITLEENGTTGYTWSYEIKNTDILQFVNDEVKADKSGKAGAPGKHIFEFSGVKKGETTIVFTNKRDWEGGETAETKEITVTVDSNGTVTEK